MWQREEENFDGKIRELEGVDVISKFYSSLDMLRWNNAVWLVQTSRVSFNCQSECLI